jgi:hypothetical protein
VIAVDMLHIGFVAVYVVLLVALLVVELTGVRRRSPDGTGGGDTISELWWWIRRRHPWLVVPMAAFLAWLFAHFVFDGW